MQSTRKVLKSALTALITLAVLLFIYYPSAKAADKKKFVVVIDAGHGGSDHGAIENGINEKDVTLSVAQKLGALIKKKLKDTEVIYTRTQDEFISLQKRADIANKAKADLFVSIHCNSVDRSNKNRANVVGATTYVLGHHKDNDNLEVAKRENAVVELDSDDSVHYSEFDPTSAESNIIFQMTQKKNFQNSIRFAADVQREMEAAGRVSRGVQQAGFWVLWSTAAPAALIELDFLCNPQQAIFLNSKDGQDKLAGAIFNAVKNYEKYFRMSLGLASHETADSPSGKEKTATADASDREQATQSSHPQEDVTAMADLPAASRTAERKNHRTETATSSKKQTSGGAHRRRSAASRNEGGSRIEEVVIAMTEELTTSASETVSHEETPATSAQTAKKASKTNKKENKKTSAASSKPGRRDKEKKAGRRGVKQSVNVDYRVLLFVSDDELQANDAAFKGLSPVATFRENNKFKYTYGESDDRTEMEGLLLEISSLFPEARVIKCYY